MDLRNTKESGKVIQTATEERTTIKPTPIQPIYGPQKHQRVRQSYPDINRRQESTVIQREPLPEIKTEAEAPVPEEIVAEDPNQMVVSSEYHEDTAYEEYQLEYEDQQVQYETIPFNTTQDRSYSSGWNKAPKPFPCQYCDKSFSNRDSLGKHTKSHTGQTYCDICDKNFSTVPNLRAHISTVHNKA